MPPHTLNSYEWSTFMRKALGLTFALTCLLLWPALAGASHTAPAAQAVTVKEVDFKITLTPKPKAGHIRFTVKDAGKTNHDLWIRGGGTTVHTKLLKPGQSTVLTTTLRKGIRYRFWCHFDAHASFGMSLYITPH